MASPQYRLRRHGSTRLATRLDSWLASMTVAALVASVLVAGSLGAQATTPAPARPAVQAPGNTTVRGPDLQGLWDFEMRVGDRTSPGFLALGPVEGRWAGSITMYLTNTLAIRELTVTGDSVRMVVASMEGDVRFKGRLTDEGRRMEGIVEYHGGALLPMVVTRRPRPVVPR